MGAKNKPLPFKVTPVRTDGATPYVHPLFGRSDLNYKFSSPPQRYTKADVSDDECCTKCGWPLKSVSSSIVLTGQGRGDRKYAHQVCPSLSERKALRKQALENA